MCPILQAPGHIPWESVQGTSVTDWIPEGSIFSAECFSRTLSQLRASSSRTSICPANPSTIQPLDLAETDLVDEPQHSKIPLEDNTQDADKPPLLLAKTQKLFLPSLVVSNSQSTFPLTLESSHSVSSALASRRGKKAPPPLHLDSEKKTKELSYPEIPTAFLGSPSQHFPQFEYANRNNDPTPPFEEMITNLRLQCLTMSLQTPQDASFNSRSCLGSESVPDSNPIDKIPALDSDEWHFATSLCEDYDFLPTLQPYEANDTHRPTPRKGKSGLSLVPCKAEKYELVANVGVESDPHELSNNFPSVIPLGFQTSEGGLVRNATSPPSLRSAMTKGRVPHCRTPLKNVRFVLTHEEIMKDAESSAALQEDTMAPLDRLNDEHSGTSLPLTRKSSSLRSTWRKARAVAISFPARNSVATDSANRSVFRYPSQSLGRHSLSRLIKGPMFSAGKDSKDTYMAVVSETNSLDKQTVRKESRIHDKRSRLPVPLRNIFTHFK